MMDVRRILGILPVSLLLTAFAACGGSISGTSTGSGSGCNSTPSSTSPASCPARVAIAGASFSGKVLAGTQPVSGAAVQLYAAGVGGNGSAPTALLAIAVMTGTSGAFVVSGNYSCPSAQTPIYLVSKGGETSGGAANAALWLMTALGPCGNAVAGSAFVVNEVTTAASVWALAPFMSSGGSVGASCTNTTGLDNAFMTASNLASASSGVSPGAGIPANLTISTSKLDTLANALTSCTLSSGGTACTGLFTAATTGGAAPTNTLDAALNIARAPARNVPAIYALAAGSAMFSPALTAAPPDFMLHSTVKGGGLASPATVGVAASGDVWVSSYFNTISEFSPAGAAIFPAGISGNGINQSYGMALDVTGNVWIANEQTGSSTGSGDVDELSSSGSSLETGLTAGGINFPIAVAADSNGNMWFADYGDSKVTLLSTSGSAVSSSTGWGGTSLAAPVAIAVDSNHNAWVANQGGQLPITKISADGSEVTSFDCDCNAASGIAIDQSSNVWVANYYGNSISEVSGCGTLLLDAATGGGVDHPQGIAVDGGGSVWVANFLGNSLSQIGNSSGSTSGTFISPTTGFGTDASISQPYALAIDASGSIWVSNFGNSTLTQFIGVAAPVKTPLIGPPQLP
jgi:streptogramin lyase